MEASLTDMCACAQWYCRFSSSSGSISGISERNLPATETSASCGHGWNQSMTVQLMSAGKFLARILNLSPTGEKQRHTCRYFLTLSRKKSHRFSGVSRMPASFTSLRTALHISSFSSLDIRSGMYPELNRSLMYTRKRSCTIWPSVIRNVTGWPLAPAFLYSSKRSTLKSAMP